MQNVIRVAFSDQTDSGEAIGSRLEDEAGTVYHIVDNSANPDSTGNIMLVTTTGEANLQTTEGLLEQLAQGTLGDNT